jgi:FtsP/CotA-like multicopper oxidase with cupredoxin domain
MMTTLRSRSKRGMRSAKAIRRFAASSGRWSINCGQSTSVHWHGMELESYYDGVPGWGARGKELTPVIKPGGSFVVRFTPPRVGTFMYHTHLNDEAQISGGLYGPLIVVESAEKVDRHYRF